MLKIPPEENETKHQKMTGDADSHEEVDRRGHNVNVSTNGIQPPRELQGHGHRKRAERGGERV